MKTIVATTAFSHGNLRALPGGEYPIGDADANALVAAGFATFKDATPAVEVPPAPVPARKKRADK